MHRLELVCGAPPWLAGLQWLLLLFAALGLLFSPSTWPWIVFAISVLLAVHLAGLTYLRRVQPPGILQLHTDGGFRLQSGAQKFDGELLRSAWVSRYLCVVRWKPLSEPSRPCLVCASENHQDDYRRLLVHLRLKQGN